MIMRAAQETSEGPGNFTAPRHEPGSAIMPGKRPPAGERHAELRAAVRVRHRTNHERIAA